MKVFSKKKLIQIIKEFDIIIFDLDDTLYNEENYIKPALKKVSKFLEKKTGVNKDIIFKELKINKKSKNKIFDNFLQKFNFPEKKSIFIINKCLNIYQNFNCLNLRKVPSHKNLLKSYFLKKDFFLVTNGNLQRQNRKIKNLKISKFFKMKFILDGRKKKLKPSISSVKRLLNFIKRNKNKKSIYIGDNKIIDGNFAKNLNINFFHYKF